MTTPKIVAPKKLIEVALPLDDINRACAREKSIRHGHPSTLHLWWARRPLAAARAVLFAQLVNDPSWKYTTEEMKKPQVRSAITRRRNELFRLITELVQWENTTNQDVLGRARDEIRASWEETCAANRTHPEAKTLFDPKRLPAVHDPFAGGGTIPLEAQRLGLEAHATDLNPVAVLLNMATIEVPPRLVGWVPVGPVGSAAQSVAPATQEWPGATGLAEDVMRYAHWISDEAYRRIGHLYPTVEITADLMRARPDLAPYRGQQLTVIAWLWARTVASPNPAAAGAQVPLVGNFLISQKAGREAWVEPIVVGTEFSFRVHTGPPVDRELVSQGTRTSRGANFRCVISGAAITSDYVKEEASAGRLGWRLLGVVAAGARRRVYLSPTPEMEAIAQSAKPQWKPEVEFFAKALGFRLGNYGLSKWSDLFTPRQTLALDTFSQLVGEARALAIADAERAGQQTTPRAMSAGADRAKAFGDAIAIYTALAVSRLANRQSTNTFWHTSGEKVEQVFARQALPMVWDTAEGNPFSESSGNFIGQAEYLAKALGAFPALTPGTANQAGAADALYGGRIISTDPPYYDNIGYADLS